MVSGAYHCSLCGLNFETDVKVGEVTVTCPNGHVLPYEIDPEEETSRCTCPKCQKIFQVDLVLDGPDLLSDDESAWSEYYNELEDGDFVGFLNRIPARRDGFYERNQAWRHKGSDSTANRRTLVSPSHLLINIGGPGPYAYEIEAAVELDLDTAGNWDNSQYATAANRAGKDFYIYACQPASEHVPLILLSANSTYPTGHSASDSRKVGGFHCLPGDCVTLPSGHPYKDFLTGDILFNSIWDLKDLPRSPPEGMAKISLTPWDGKPAGWRDIYLASGDGSVCTSVFGATIQDTKDWNTFVEYAARQGKRLLRDAEFQIAALGSNEETNIAGSADPGTVTFPVDTAGRSMISNYGLIGMCGVMWQWLDEQSYRYDPDGSVQAASQTAIITYVASLEGVPVYLLWDGPVPYLGANIAADIWIAAGSYKFQIKAVADPAAIGGTQIYFRDAATQPLRLYSAVISGQNAIIQCSNPDFSLVVVYHATPATQGVELRYDNATHNRLEAVNTGGVNASIDLATSPGWSWYDLPTGVGSLYKQGAQGDVKLFGGGSWNDASYGGRRSRLSFSRRSTAILTSVVGSGWIQRKLVVMNL